MTADRMKKLAELREPFPAEVVGKMPREVEERGTKSRCNVCGGYHAPARIHLDYVGHAPVTDRLLSVDPEWSWEPYATDEHGYPILDRDRNGSPVGLWIKLTVLGVTRPGYGSCTPGKAEAVKELIGDAIRNGAMRFGVALDLWTKTDLESHINQESRIAEGDAQSAGHGQPPPQPKAGPVDPPKSAGSRKREPQADLPIPSASPQNNEDQGEAVEQSHTSPAPASSWSLIEQAVKDKRVATGKVVAAAHRIALKRNVFPDGGIGFATVKDLPEEVLADVVADLGLAQEALV